MGVTVQLRKILAIILFAVAFLGVCWAAQAASTYSGLPAASQPLGNVPTYVPMDQGTDCTVKKPQNCLTVQSDALRIGQPVQTSCVLNVSAPFPYQTCIDTSQNPPVFNEWIGTQWWPIATLSSTLGYIPTAAGGLSFKNVTKTANYSLGPNDSGIIFNNQGAPGNITFTLPAASFKDGYVACFYDVMPSTQLFAIKPQNTDTIVLATSVAQTGGRMTTVYAGSEACLIANAAANQWTQVMAPVGVWNIQQQNTTNAQGAAIGFLGDSSSVFDPFPINNPLGFFAHTEDCTTNNGGVPVQFNGNIYCRQESFLNNHGLHTAGQKSTSGTFYDNSVFFASGQNFGTTSTFDVYGSGDYQMLTLTENYRGGIAVAGDEGPRGLSIAMLQHNFFSTSPILGSTVGGGNTTTTQAITGSPTVQTITVANSTGFTVGEWVITNRSDPTQVIGATQLTAVGTNTLSGIFEINQPGGVTVTPATVVTYNAQTQFPDPGEGRWLVDYTPPPYTTGTISQWPSNCGVGCTNGAIVTGSGTAWASNMVGGDAKNPGCVSLTSDTTASGIPSWYPIQNVGSATVLNLISGREVDSPGGAYQILPCAMILRVITNATATVTTLVLDTNTFTWNANDQVETAYGPQIGATGINLRAEDYLPNSNTVMLSISEEGTVSPPESYMQITNFTGHNHTIAGVNQSRFLNLIDDVGGQVNLAMFSSGTNDWITGALHSGALWSLDQYGLIENQMVEDSFSVLQNKRLGPVHAGAMELDPKWQFNTNAHNLIAANINDSSGLPLTTNTLINLNVTTDNGATWHPKFVVDETGTITAGTLSPGLPGVYTLYQVDSPFYVSPSGTMGNNGAFTLGTALPSAYQQVFLYFPANAIFTGSTAGWYCSSMSTTTAGIVYNEPGFNPYTSGPIPTTGPDVSSQICYGVGTPFVSTGPGGYTGVTAAVNGPTFTVPGNNANNLTYRINYIGMYNPNGNSKTTTLMYGGHNLGQIGTSSATTYGQEANFLLFNSTGNVGVTSVPIPNVGDIPAPGLTRAIVDMTSPQTLTVQLQMATATDYIGLEHFAVEEINGP